MKNFLLILLCLTFVGCGNLSPRFDPRLRQKINNQEGRIDEIESNQNTIKREMENIQQGLNNQQNNNNGIQILSGTGGLFLGLTCILGMIFIILYYRQQAVLHEKTADILAEKIVDKNDPALEDDVFKAAMYTDVEESILKLVSKHQQQKL